MASSILEIFPLNLHYPTQDPFLFCAHHLDFYPEGNGNLQPKVSLANRNLGNDFTPKDGWRMYHGLKVPGFPAHPHRGFETITIVEKGLVDHSDSYGGKARYGAGDVQWMTAGRGIQHSEMFPLIQENSSNHLELFQIWLNLPAKNKMVVPEFKIFQYITIPIFDEEKRKANLKLVAGEFATTIAPKLTPNSWANNPENEVLIFILELEPYSKFLIPKTQGLFTRSLYFYEGSFLFLQTEKIPSATGMFLNPNEDISIQNGDSLGKILFLQARPILEPIVNYGPFVMNTREEIYQAIADYNAQKFGKWEFDSFEPTHAKRERFVEYPNAKLV